jgi:hypothetical protein
LDASSPASLSPRVFIIPVCITLVVWYLVGAGVVVARRLFARPPPVPQGTHDADDDEGEGVPVARPAPVAASPPLSRILLLPFMLLYGAVAVVVEAVLHPVRAAKSALDLARTSRLCLWGLVSLLSYGLASQAGVLQWLASALLEAASLIAAWVQAALAWLGCVLGTVVDAVLSVLLFFAQPLVYVLGLATHLLAVVASAVAIATRAMVATLAALLAAVYNAIAGVVGPVLALLWSWVVTLLSPVVTALAWAASCVALALSTVAHALRSAALAALALVTAHALPLGVTAAAVGAVLWRAQLGVGARALATLAAATWVSLRTQLAEVSALVQQTGGRVLLDPNFWFPAQPRRAARGRWATRRGGRGGGLGSRSPSARGGRGRRARSRGDDEEYRPPSKFDSKWDDGGDGDDGGGWAGAVGGGGGAKRRTGSRGPSRGGRGTGGSRSPGPATARARRAASPGAAVPIARGPAWWAEQGEAGATPGFGTQRPAESYEAPVEWVDPEVVKVEPSAAGGAGRGKGGPRGPK